jgi:hypothetical protein
MSEYSPPNWTEPLSIYNPINFQQTAQTTNGGGGGGSGFLKYPVAQGSQTMKNTLIAGSFSVQASNAVNMGANIVQNAGTPVNPTDLATKAYVDLNAGTQNLTSVLTAGNTTGNFHISHADNYGDIYNGAGGEEWVVACDPIQFSSTATNDLYLASNAIDNFVRIGSYTGSTFTESGRIGSLGTGEKRAIFAGTLNAVCIEDATGSKGTSGQVLTAGGGNSLVWGAGGGGGAGTLDQTLALGNTATGAYANITLTNSGVGNIANPITKWENTNATGSVALECFKNKPTASVNGDVIFTQSCYGKDAGNNKQEYTRINHSVRDNSSGVEDGSIEFGCYVNGSVNTFLQINGNENEVNILRNLDMTGNNITTNTGSMTITTASSTGLGNLSATAKAGIALTASNGSVNTTATTGIASSTTTGQIALTATGGSITLTSNSTTGTTQIAGGGATFAVGNTIGIQTGQGGNVRTILRTGYTDANANNLDYYPSYVVENSGLTTSLSLPYIPRQNLIIINSGISPTYSWSDVGDVVAGNPVSAFLRASSGQVWVGVSGFIYVYSGLTFSNPPVFTYTLNGGGDVNVFYESNGFMYVGGQFGGVIGQPQAQSSLLRFAGSGTLTPAFDPMFSAGASDIGFAGPVNAIACDNTNLYVGGLFSSTFGSGSPVVLSNLCIISNPFAAGGSQVYSNDVVSGIGQFSTNGVVNAMEWVNVSGANYIYVGGNFTEVAGGFQLIAYGAIYGVGWTSTPFTTIGVSGGFNAPITSFGKAIDGVHILFTGSFNFVDGTETIKYGGFQDYSNFTNQLYGFGIATLSQSTSRNCIAIYNSGTYNFFITDDRQVWFGTDLNAWEDGGVAFSTGTPTGIAWDSATTYPYVAMPTSTYGFRIGIPSTSSAVFQLPSQAFRTQAGTFSKATLPEYASQLFVADVNGLYYHAVGTPICTFSN